MLFDCHSRTDAYLNELSRFNVLTPLVPDLVPKTYSLLESIVVTDEEVIDTLESLNTNKDSGPDLISNKMLKGVARSIAKPLMELFNRLLKDYEFPDLWKLSHVTSLLKKKVTNVFHQITDQLLY